MPDVHIPKVDEHGSSHVLKLLLEVALISVGVFLGLMGEQWTATPSARNRAWSSCTTTC